jgi:hypothetical protein
MDEAEPLVRGRLGLDPHAPGRGSPLELLAQVPEPLGTLRVAGPRVVRLEPTIEDQADGAHGLAEAARLWRPSVGEPRLEAVMRSDPPLPGEDPADILRRKADRVASMILTSSYSDLECALAERELRMECLALLPDRMELYDLVYTSRFRRLREQFRG